MFFVMWGTTVRRESQGVVADLCPYCCELRPFEVMDHYRVGHLYYIPLGRGTFVARTRQCRRCWRQLAFDERTYSGAVQVVHARQMSLEEVLARTNPRLRHRIDELARLEEMAKSTAYRDQGGDARMLECVQWLRWLSSMAVNEEALHLVASWSTLSDDERDALLWKLRDTAARARAALR
jgi:hypothetical protein